MVYQDELRAAQVSAIWAGDFGNESDLTEYIGQPFERDFGFLLDQHDLPEFARLFNEPRLHAHYNRPFVKTDARALLSKFPVSETWINEAAQLFYQNGYGSMKTVVVFPHLRYRENLCQNPNARLHFIGNVIWTDNCKEWQLRFKPRVDSPPFPPLVRHDYAENAFLWRGRVHLKSWSGFASREAIKGEFMSFRFSELLPGDYNLIVEPLDSSGSTLPSPAQAKAFQYLRDNEAVIRDTVLNAIFNLYPRWRDSYYGEQISSDSGQTYKSAWELPQLFPPGNMPEITDSDQLLPLIRLRVVDIRAQEGCGVANVGFEFACKWDEEHGLGVLTHEAKVLDVGNADTAFASGTA